MEPTAADQYSDTMLYSHRTLGCPFWICRKNNLTFMDPRLDRFFPKPNMNSDGAYRTQADVISALHFKWNIVKKKMKKIESWLIA